MSHGHTHEMRRETARAFKCSSCAFRCTPAALAKVQANRSLHRVVRAGSPQAKVVWNG